MSQPWQGLEIYETHISSNARHDEEEHWRQHRSFLLVGGTAKSHWQKTSGLIKNDSSLSHQSLRKRDEGKTILSLRRYVSCAHQAHLLREILTALSPGSRDAKTEHGKHGIGGELASAMASLQIQFSCLSSSQSSFQGANLSKWADPELGRHGARSVHQKVGGSSHQGGKGLACRASRSSPDDVVKHLGRALWGRGLPPGALVQVARQLWGTGWQIMMGQLAPSRNEGEYDRPKSQFRSRPQRSPSSPGNFHLYVATTCPWAHRALIVHCLKGLEDAVTVSVLTPGGSGLWEFSRVENGSAGANGKFLGTKDKANGKARLVDAYKARKGGYEGRATVPMLWDQNRREVVNNESADIIEILNSDFNDLAKNPDLDLAPASARADMDRWNEIIYANVNNGVYRCGFAQGQKAYEEAVDSVFSALDMVEAHLATARYLCGDPLTLADVRLFTTLYRFDPVYSILFKCSKQKVAQYPNLSGYLRDLYQIPGVARTCDLEAIMDGYYRVLFPLNPGSICPAIPRSSLHEALSKPHGREALSKIAEPAGYMNWN